jgi:dipeptidyl aminopeptidase/acylaminoacyl peptidase
LALSLSLPWVATGGRVQQTKRSFTITDEIELTQFGNQYWGQATQFSPDGSYFAVDIERGRLDVNRVEDSLRFYRTQEVDNFFMHSDKSQPPPPVWAVDRSDREGPVITDWRWLPDSSGVAFLERGSAGNSRLVLADLRRKTIEPLTSTTEIIGAFDMRDRRYYAYTVADQAEVKKWQVERRAAAIVGTDRFLNELLFPDDPLVVRRYLHRSYLCAVVNGKHLEVKSRGLPLFPSGEYLALSPDGGSLVTMLPVPDVPPSWETLYPPPFPSSPYRIRSNYRDVKSEGSSVNEYVRINLQTGAVQLLTDAPTSNDAGWWAVRATPSWSSDGQGILLPGTFIKSKDQEPSRPCVAVMDLSSNNRTCVEGLKALTENGVEEGYHSVFGARFAGGNKHRVIVIYKNPQESSLKATEYQWTTEGGWQVAVQSKGVREVGQNGLEVILKESFDDPPRLVAIHKGISRIIWDPNPQLHDVELGWASVYTWTDKGGRDWRGGLFKPADYKTDQRYPLVIQTHGFAESLFLPSGAFSTAFAARALAAAGIVVLQVDDGQCPKLTPDEGRCAVSGYESGAKQLVSEGLVDPERIGIIGFSRTCFYVMETLTTGSLDLKAASITDGVMETYVQYMTDIGGGNTVAHEADSMIGAQPFGDGLQQWLKRSPGFNLHKMNTPLLVVGAGPASVLLMWEPYAGLRYLHKPVELLMLNTHEHILTNPAVRMASQGGSVDWFRFWLKQEEDPNPAKAEQYARWRELRKLQTRD